jgi:CheY-like chemotaxis protein
MDINLKNENMDGTTVMKLIRKIEKYLHIKIFAEQLTLKIQSYLRRNY